jgi:deazaflavin-dependent oxidoreductase (nitroreductase family)
MSSTLDDPADWNRKIIDEFRANAGKLGGNFAGAPLLLLHTIGARTGLERVNPVMYQELSEGAVAVFASKGGAPTNPDWFANLVVHPEVTVEIGAATRQFRARTATAQERAPIWDTQKQRYPGFAEYETATDREIPVVILEPA